MPPLLTWATSAELLMRLCTYIVNSTFLLDATSLMCLRPSTSLLGNLQTENVLK